MKIKIINKLKHNFSPYSANTGAGMELREKQF
jgi:hypothetical protein